MYFILFLYFLLKPFYFFSSGGLQAFDFVFILGFLFYLFNGLKLKTISEFLLLKLFCIFAVWVIILNCAWAILDKGWSSSYLMNSFFYIYNFVFAYYNYVAYYRNGLKYKKFINLAFVLSVLANFILYFSEAGKFYSDYRAMLYFNNPNQMAYYFMMIVIIAYLLKLKARHFIALGSFFFIVLSASRATIICFLLFFILKIFQMYYRKSKLKLVVCGAVIITGSLFFLTSNLGKNIKQVNHVMERMNEDDSDDGLYSRGWDRVHLYYEYAFIGFGEGGFESGEKFSKVHSPKLEVHSTWANFIISYGIVGVIIIFYILYISFNWRDFQYYIPVFIHGIIQVDSRQSYFWLVIVLAYLLNKKRKKCHVHSNICSVASV